LVNFGDSTLQFRRRYSPDDLQTMVPANVTDVAIPLGAGMMYGHPIAVLLGPLCKSWGDVTAHQLSYIPSARFFGKSPHGAYAGHWWCPYPLSVSGYSLYYPDFIEVDHRFPDVQLLNREFPIDEDVWLTPDDVAKGDDTVVKRALAWINTTNGVAEGEPQVPSQFFLHQNYPNPFNPSTTIKFEMPKSSIVRLSVSELLGREVSVLVNERRAAGVHEVTFDGSCFSSGVYFYRIQVEDFVKTRKLMVLK
jgi:hypothetical protein